MDGSAELLQLQNVNESYRTQLLRLFRKRQQTKFRTDYPLTIQMQRKRKKIQEETKQEDLLTTN